MTEERIIAPERLENLVEIFATFDRPWWVAGGWATALICHGFNCGAAVRRLRHGVSRSCLNPTMATTGSFVAMLASGAR